MSVIVNSVLTSLDGGEAEAFSKAKRLFSGEKVKEMHIRRRSVDARRRDRVCFCFSVEVSLESEKAEKAAAKRMGLTYRESAKAPEFGSYTPAVSPVVVGFGPAGMFCALVLARAGAAPVVIERGADMDSRVQSVERFWQTGALDKNTNVQFGEGGAGTFSDGKLNTGINDPLCDFVLSEFVRHGADEKILTQARPHVGTDVIRQVVKNIRKEIEDLGGHVLFGTALKDIKIKNGAVAAVVTDRGEIAANTVVLAIGHSARDTFEMLNLRGFLMERKAFSVGVRAEQLQSVTDAAMYGRFAGHPSLLPAEYKLSHREGDRGVYSFCMCPGGYVVAAASEEGGVAVNGMSYSLRDGVNSNSAIVASVLPQDFEGSGVLAGVEFQRALERRAFALGGGRYRAPCQNAQDFVNGVKTVRLGAVLPTYSRGVELADMNGLFPKRVEDLIKTGLCIFDRREKGFMLSGILTGVETRTSSPVRILRNERGRAISTDGVYPCGEGAGYAGGITSAAVDGIKTAVNIIKKRA